MITPHRFSKGVVEMWSRIEENEGLIKTLTLGSRPFWILGKKMGFCANRPSEVSFSAYLAVLTDKAKKLIFLQ